MKRATAEVDDLQLPEHEPVPGFGGWAVLCTLLVATAVMALLLGAYGVIDPRTAATVRPSPWATACVVLALASALPNAWLARRSRANDVDAVRRGLALMVLLGLAVLGLRGAELATLDLRWNTNAHGSVVWALLVAQAALLAIGVLASAALLAWRGTSRSAGIAFDPRPCRFIVLSALLVYGLVYWMPRWS